MFKTFVNDVFLHIGLGWLTGQTNVQSRIPTQSKSRGAFINTQSILSGHRRTNMKTLILTSKAAWGETVKKS